MRNGKRRILVSQTVVFNPGGDTPGPGVVGSPVGLTPSDRKGPSLAGLEILATAPMAQNRLRRHPFPRGGWGIGGPGPPSRTQGGSPRGTPPTPPGDPPRGGTPPSPPGRGGPGGGTPPTPPFWPKIGQKVGRTMEPTPPNGGGGPPLPPTPPGGYPPRA